MGFNDEHAGAIIFDIETAPIDGALAFLPPVEPDKRMTEELHAPVEADKRLTDPVKIAADIARKTWAKNELPAKIAADIAERQDVITSKCSLDPDLCWIPAIGWTFAGEVSIPKVLICRNEDQERGALKLFWSSAALLGGGVRRLISFNGLGFDLPVLIRRSQLLEVEYPFINLDRYRTPHLDLMQRLSFNGLIKAHSLAFYIQRFGLAFDPDPVTGADIPALVRAALSDATSPEEATALWHAVQKHCEGDVLRTAALARRLGYLAPMLEPAEVA